MTRTLGGDVQVSVVTVVWIMADFGSAFDELNGSFALELGSVVGFGQYGDIYLRFHLSGLQVREAFNASHIHDHCPSW
ncbi:MAG: hypothetical protein IID37_06490 [Planctomycetes bacterium]|nr:hypothetical protein [Planctomycetota bacterium]